MSLKRRLDLYIANCHLEISGLGEVEVIDGVVTVTALYLLPQRVNASETTLSADTVVDFLASAVEQGVDPSKLRLWWHSHAGHSVGWSGTDEGTIDSFDASQWWLSIVGNHAGDYLARVDVFPSETLPFRFTQKASITVEHDDDDLVDEVRSEIEEYVQEAPELPPFPVAGKRSSRRGQRRRRHVQTPPEGGP